MCPLFSKMIEWVTLTLGYNPYFIISFWAKIYFFLAVIHLFGIAYLSKWLNHSETPCKMITYGPRVQRSGNTSKGCQT